MSDKLPKIAATTPIEVDLIEGKNYFYCACGLAAKQPFCDGEHKGTGMSSHKFTAKHSGKAWLCRCKKTKNPPFCDGAHSKL